MPRSSADRLERLAADGEVSEAGGGGGGPEPARREALRAAMAEQDLPAFLVTDAVNRRYLTGFTGSAGWLVVTAGADWLLVDGRYEEQAGEEARGCRVAGYRERRELYERLREILGGERRLGFEADAVSVALRDALQEKLEGVDLTPARGLVERLRAVKDGGEVAAIRRAVAVAEEAWRRVADLVAPGRTERELAVELEYALRRLGADAPAFETIVLAGAASALPHGRPGHRRLEAGRLLLCDFGARVAGYHSDLTRTLVPAGEPDARQEEVHAAVLAAQRAALAALRPGATGGEVHAAAAGILEQAGLGDRFVHGTGHGVGLAIHEAPRLGKDSEDVLEAGMVVTVEPGVYIPGWGGVRVEDMALVTAAGCEVLTGLARKLHRQS